MTYSQKIDILDMIIEVLRVHEKAFDSLIDRLEKVVAMVERRAMR